MDEHEERHDHEGFLRGPSDLLLLVSFGDHVVVRLWESEVRMKNYLIVVIFIMMLIYNYKHNFFFKIREK